MMQPDFYHHFSMLSPQMQAFVERSVNASRACVRSSTILWNHWCVNSGEPFVAFLNKLVMKSMSFLRKTLCHFD